MMSGLRIALATLWSPRRALKDAADGRHFVWPLLLATLVSAGYTAILMPRVDWKAFAEKRLEALPPEELAKLTPHEREEKIETVGKVQGVSAYASAVVGTSAVALVVALCLWLGFKVAGGTPGFVGTLAVSAASLLPGAIKSLLSIPALLKREGMEVEEVVTLLPSSLASLAPEGTPMPQLSLLGSLDLFSIWAVVLIALGMAHVAKVSLLRSSLATGLLWAGYVLVFRFALPSLTMSS